MKPIVVLAALCSLLCAQPPDVKTEAASEFNSGGYGSAYGGNKAPPPSVSSELDMEKAELVHSLMFDRERLVDLIAKYKLQEELVLSPTQITELNRIRRELTSDEIYRDSFPRHPIATSHVDDPNKLSLQEIKSICKVAIVRVRQQLIDADEQTLAALRTKQSRRLKQIAFQYFLFEKPHFKAAFALYDLEGVDEVDWKAYAKSVIHPDRNQRLPLEVGLKMAALKQMVGTRKFENYFGSGEATSTTKENTTNPRRSRRSSSHFAQLPLEQNAREALRAPHVQLVIGLTPKQLQKLSEIDRPEDVVTVLTTPQAKLLRRTILSGQLRNTRRMTHVGKILQSHGIDVDFGEKFATQANDLFADKAKVANLEFTRKKVSAAVKALSKQNVATEAELSRMMGEPFSFRAPIPFHLRTDKETSSASEIEQRE